MELIEKLALLNLSEKEEKKAREKFIQDLYLVSEDELMDILALLKEKGVVIKNAREIKVLTNSLSELQKDFSILEEIHHEGIYRQDPNMLNRNVIDLHRMRMYYDQNGISYMNENGEYDLKMFTEDAWRKISSKEEKIEEIDFQDDLVTLAPDTLEQENEIEPLTFNEQKTPTVLEETEPNLVSFSDIANHSLNDNHLFEQPEEPILDDFSDLDNIEPVSSFKSEQSDLERAEEKSNDIANLRAELEKQFAELEKYKAETSNDELKFDDDLNNIVSFNDIEPESFGMGGRAA